MSLPYIRRGALAAGAVVVSIAALSACGSGNNAQTLEIKPNSAATSVGDIKLQNVTLVTQPKGGASGPAVVTGSVFNSGTKNQTLQSVTLPGTSATVQLKPAKGSGPVTVPAGGVVQFGGKGNASAVIQNGSEASKNGDAQQVVFTFSRSGDVSLRALVVPATSYFTGVGPTVMPSPSTSVSSTPSAGVSASNNPEVGGNPPVNSSESNQPGAPGDTVSTPSNPLGG